MSELTILLTNDDGIEARGLWALHSSLSATASRVLVVAPDRNQSACSHSLTLERPLKVVEHSADVYAVSGTPTDCVLLGAQRIAGTSLHAVVAGVNHGPNLGEDVLYSGTVAAALEGSMLGIPSLAVSLTDPYRGSFEFAAATAVDLLFRLLDGALPVRSLLNINVPGVAVDRIRGLRAGRLGKRIYGDVVGEKQDGVGGPAYVIGGGELKWHPGTGTDFDAVEQGYVAVTPLRYELTDEGCFESLAEMLRAIPPAGKVNQKP
jgi:5'-nucleotidase